LEKGLKEFRKEFQQVKLRCLFDWDFILKTFVLNEFKEAELKGAVETCQSFGVSKNEAIRKVADLFDIEENIAREYVEEHWK
jgi:hypothetical protein